MNFVKKYYSDITLGINDIHDDESIFETHIILHNATPDGHSIECYLGNLDLETIHNIGQTFLNFYREIS